MAGEHEPYKYNNCNNDCNNDNDNNDSTGNNCNNTTTFFHNRDGLSGQHKTNKK